MKLLRPINSEKFIKLLELENKIAFEVELNSSKKEVKEEKF